MFEIEAVGCTVYTCTISDEDEQKIKQYIKDHAEEMEFMSDKEKIIKAVSECDGIELYKDSVESDFWTEEIKWSEFEERSAEEIIGEETENG